MTPGDFGSIQEGREGLSTEDYIAWRLPYVYLKALYIACIWNGFVNALLRSNREEEETEEYPFPIALRSKKTNDRPMSPLDSVKLNGD
jgi:glycogen(starch) synthase